MVALPLWCIRCMCGPKVSLGSNHKPSHRSSVGWGFLTCEPKSKWGLVCFLCVKCINCAFFWSNMAPWRLPRSRDLSPSSSNSSMFMSISRSATRCVTSSMNPSEILSAFRVTSIFISSVEWYKIYKITNKGEPCGSSSSMLNSPDKKSCSQRLVILAIK